MSSIILPVLQLTPQPTYVDLPRKTKLTTIILPTSNPEHETNIVIPSSSNNGINLQIWKDTMTYSFNCKEDYKLLFRPTQSILGHLTTNYSKQTSVFKDSYYGLSNNIMQKNNDEWLLKREYNNKTKWIHQITNRATSGSISNIGQQQQYLQSFILTFDCCPFADMKEEQLFLSVDITRDKYLDLNNKAIISIDKLSFKEGDPFCCCSYFFVNDGHFVKDEKLLTLMKKAALPIRSVFLEYLFRYDSKTYDDLIEKYGLEDIWFHPSFLEEQLIPFKNSDNYFDIMYRMEGLRDVEPLSPKDKDYYKDYLSD
ncbi:hypothetical protein ABK040_003566 [Willaertia magna]